MIIFYGGFSIINMKVNENLYKDNSIEVSAEIVSKDFDDVDFDPVEVDDANEEAAELYGI